MEDEQASRSYRIRTTVMEMLRERGYLVVDFEVQMTKMEFIDKFGHFVKRTLPSTKPKRASLPISAIDEMIETPV